MDRLLYIKLKTTEFVVEATDFESLTLSKIHCVSYSKEYGKPFLPAVTDLAKKVKWEPEGFIFHKVIVGYYNKLPITIHISFSLLNGHRVMFYYPTSEIVNYHIIKKWLKKNCNPKWDKGRQEAYTDATNFHRVLDHVLSTEPIYELELLLEKE